MQELSKNFINIYYAFHCRMELTESQMIRVLFFTLNATDIPRSVFPAPQGSMMTPDLAEDKK